MLKSTVAIVILSAIINSIFCCDVSHIQMDVFKENSYVKTVPFSKEEIQHAEKIVISRQNIPVLCKDMFTNSNISVIIIQHSNVEKIENGAFNNLPYLGVIDLHGNKLTEIQNGVFDNLQVQVVVLLNNSISKIGSDVFAPLVNLTHVDLHINQLTKIDKNWFVKNSKLHSINLSHNLIRTIPEDFLKFDVPNQENFAFYMTDNPLETIEKGAFQNINIIQNLHLINNKIKNVSANLFVNVGAVNIVSLDFASNTCLGDNDLVGFKLTRYLYFRTGYYEEDCLKSMAEWGTENNIAVKLFPGGVRT